MDENECCYIRRCNKCTQPYNEIPRIHEDKLNRWATQTFKMESKHAWQPIIWSSRLSCRLEHIYDNCSNEGIFGLWKKQNGSTCICYVHKNLNATNLITSDLNTIGLNSSKFLELLLKLGNCCRQRQTSNINGVALHCKITGYNLLSTSNENITNINFYMLLRCANMAKVSEPLKFKSVRLPSKSGRLPNKCAFTPKQIAHQVGHTWEMWTTHFIMHVIWWTG